MTDVKELKEWVATLSEDDDSVAISEGGLILIAQCGSYIEVGGVPEDELDDWPQEARW